jgi:hypothetical protein
MLGDHPLTRGKWITVSYGKKSQKGSRTYLIDLCGQCQAEIRVIECLTSPETCYHPWQGNKRKSGNGQNFRTWTRFISTDAKIRMV